MNADWFGGMDACSGQFVLNGIAKNIKRVMGESILVGCGKEVWDVQFGARIAMKVLLFKTNEDGMDGRIFSSAGSCSRWHGVCCSAWRRIIIAHNLSGSKSDDNRWIQCGYCDEGQRNLVKMSEENVV